MPISRVRWWPAVIIVLDRHFDDDPKRSLRKIAPIVTPWLLRRYEVREQVPDYNLVYPRQRPSPRPGSR